MTPDKLVYMANQIGSYFTTDPQPEHARQQIAEHMKKFWAPSMRVTLIETLDRDANMAAQLDEPVKWAIIEHRALLLGSASNA
ncbi:MAG: formate dehydrogenase subunit delta [Halomonas sp.]|nr:formate dehydrogenase subunit delta [Halomonas sp.]